MNLTVWSALRSRKGFTMIEALVVIVLVGVMAAIALPPFLQWRQTLEYRDTARAIASLLRNAQSRTIAENLQYRVELDTADPRRYRMTRGNLSANSTAWGLAGCNFCVDWTRIPTSTTLQRAGLNVDGAIESINYKSDGTAALAASPATIRVFGIDNAITPRFTIEVTNVGRVSVRTGP